MTKPEHLESIGFAEKPAEPFIPKRDFTAITLFPTHGEVLDREANEVCRTKTHEQAEIIANALNGVNKKFYDDIKTVNLRLALERLTDAIRWRRDSHNSDGEDLEPNEHEAFDRAEAVLAETNDDTLLVAELERAVIEKAIEWREFIKAKKAFGDPYPSNMAHLIELGRELDEAINALLKAREK